MILLSTSLGPLSCCHVRLCGLSNKLKARDEAWIRRVSKGERRNKKKKTSKWLKIRQNLAFFWTCLNIRVCEGAAALRLWSSSRSFHRRQQISQPEQGMHTAYWRCATLLDCMAASCAQCVLLRGWRRGGGLFTIRQHQRSCSWFVSTGDDAELEENVVGFRRSS